MGETAVQRVVDAVTLAAVRHFQLVLDSGAFGQFHDDVPQVSAVQPPQRNALGQPEDPVDEANLIGLAAVEKGTAGTLDDGYLVSGQETVDGSRLKWPALPEPVDGELTADRRAADGSQADSRVVTRPSSASTRVPGGQVPSLSVSTRVPFSRRIQRAGANLRAKTAIRDASSSSSLARACGSGTTLRRTLRPLP
jgi:hypothetical protein